ncbi:hypothetical protein TWF192_009714 [Orbilia oligospora]|nr:hypothetical protein TWF192_009714 [Orbilia oligospora]
MGGWGSKMTDFMVVTVDRLVHVLASGVFFSGFMKDFFCLPRPLSPPLHRITMSGSAALEYGFPSTHSTNAVSVALYSLLVLRDNPSIPDNQRIIYIVLAALYATSIVFGRVYCGMHGFLDVVVGSILGVILALAEWVYGPLTNQWVWYGTWVAPLTMTLAILMFVRIHPEPADPCPCFDDGVAFAGVVVGIEVGQWHYSKTSFGWNTPVPATVPYSFESVGLVSTSLRFVMGVAIIFIWREVAKSVLLRSPVRSPLGQENGNNNVNNSLGGYVQQQQQQRLKEEEEKASEEAYEKQERDMLSQIEKPRVRYDVEVVTKLLVYSGIAWWAVEGTPILFELVGLGAGQPGADK